MIFYLIVFLIGGYFTLTAATLFSKAARRTCTKFYDVIDYSIDNHRKHWIGAMGLAIAYYCYLWSFTFN